MNEKIPELPSVEQIDKSPLASNIRFLYVIIALLFGAVIWLSAEKPDAYLREQNKMLLQEVIKKINANVDLAIQNEDLKEQIDKLKNTINMLETKQKVFKR